jgi:branched-chain amino acid transport system ATP-binding protein
MTLTRGLREAGVTVLMIEHHVHAVVGISDRILVLDFGRKIAEGPPTAVVNDPAVIAAYLGDASAGAPPA